MPVKSEACTENVVEDGIQCAGDGGDGLKVRDGKCDSQAGVLHGDFNGNGAIARDFDVG